MGMETQNAPAKHDVAVSLADANRRYKLAVESVLEAYDAHQPAASEVTPGQLHAAVQQFLTTSLHLEHVSGPNGPIEQKDVSELGDYGITLLMDLGAWARQLGLDGTDAEFDQIALAFADWVMRHDGEIRTLEPLVDALARLANRAREPEDLEDLANLMTRVIHATAVRARQDHAKTRPSEPWRLLHLNRGIVATRTHNTVLMEQVFDELVSDLPTDARQFFADGMQQMDRFGYPVTVRTVMARYFDRWTRPRMH
jgi:hypothetical protein